MQFFQEFHTCPRLYKAKNLDMKSKTFQFTIKLMKMFKKLTNPEQEERRAELAEAKLFEAINDICLI